MTKCEICGKDIGGPIEGLCASCYIERIRIKADIVEEGEGKHHFDPRYDVRYIRKYPDKTH